MPDVVHTMELLIRKGKTTLTQRTVLWLITHECLLLPFLMGWYLDAKNPSKFIICTSMNFCLVIANPKAMQNDMSPSVWFHVSL